MEFRADQNLIHPLKMNLDVLNRKTYIQVKTKLPASIREGYARIHVTARAEEGDCMGQDGWLITVKEPGAVSVSEAAPEPATDAVKQ